MNSFCACFSGSKFSNRDHLSSKITTKDRTQTHKWYQRSNSTELDVNAKFFTAIRKRNISSPKKVKKIRNLLGRKPQPDINAQDCNDNLNTALHLAIERNELEVVNFLLNEGADTTIANGNGKTPLELAEKYNNAEIITALKIFTSPVERPLSETESFAPHNSQPDAANPIDVSGLHSNSHAAATGKQTASTVLLPFSDKLRVDTKLKLSHDKFKQIIVEFYANKQLSAIDQLKATPLCPTPYVLAQFANMAYLDYEHGEPKPPEGWKLLTTAKNDTNGYYGTAYWHAKYQQVVIAHRGTDFKSIADLLTRIDHFFAFLKDFYTDIKGVVGNKYVNQMNSACAFANKVVAALKGIEKEKVSFELFFTGHSLGGWLAQITAFATEYLEEKEGIFLKKQKREQHEPLASSTVQDSIDGPESYHPHTVVFDSPGCEKMLSKMEETFYVGHKERSTDLLDLDITSYLSAPNRINTCNKHLGTVYHICAGLCRRSHNEKNIRNTLLYDLETHSMDKIVEALDPKRGKKNDDIEPKILQVVDWPVTKD
jgi:hypothetical protein